MALIWRDLRIFLRRSWARNSPTQRISSTEYPAVSSESKIKIWEQVDSKRKWIRYQLGTGITLTLKLDFVGHHWTISAWPVSWSWSFEAKGSPLEEPKHALWDTAVGESHSQIQKTRSANLQICQLFNPKSHREKSSGEVLYFWVDFQKSYLDIFILSSSAGAETLRGSEALHTTSLGVGELFVARTVGKSRARWIFPLKLPKLEDVFKDGRIQVFQLLLNHEGWELVCRNIVMYMNIYIIKQKDFRKTEIRMKSGTSLKCSESSESRMVPRLVLKGRTTPTHTLEVIGRKGWPNERLAVFFFSGKLVIHDLLTYYPYKLMTLMTIPSFKGLPMIKEDTPRGQDTQRCQVVKVYCWSRGGSGNINRKPEAAQCRTSTAGLGTSCGVEILDADVWSMSGAVGPMMISLPHSFVVR